MDGNFTINAAANETLVISYIGYKSLEKMANTTFLTIKLQEDVTTLDEVVVVGYG